MKRLRILLLGLVLLIAGLTGSGLLAPGRPRGDGLRHLVNVLS